MEQIDRLVLFFPVEMVQTLGVEFLGVIGRIGGGERSEQGEGESETRARQRAVEMTQRGGQDLTSQRIHRSRGDIPSARPGK
jgi:hypothetical protein